MSLFALRALAWAMRSALPLVVLREAQSKHQGAGNV